MSAGIRSGVNWMRWNFRWNICAIDAHEQRLGQARRAGDQAVPAGEQRDQQLLDHLLLADDHLLELGGDPAAALPNLLDELLFHLRKYQAEWPRVLLIEFVSTSHGGCEMRDVEHDRHRCSSCSSILDPRDPV